MAIQYITNALGATNSTTSFSIDLPATQAGDLLILEFTHRGTGNGTIGGTSVTTGGLTWTLKHSQLYASDAYSGKTYWTRATGNHGGQTVTGSSLTNSCAAILTQYRGALLTADPLGTVVGESNLAASQTQAEISTTVAGAYVALVVATSPDQSVADQTCTTPGALTERAERQSTGGTDTAVAHASAEKSGTGGTGAFTWTLGVAQNSGSWAYEIKPAPVWSGSGAITVPLLTSSGAGTVTTATIPPIKSVEQPNPVLRKQAGFVQVAQTLLLTTLAVVAVDTVFRAPLVTRVVPRVVQQPEVFPNLVLRAPATHSGEGAVSLPLLTSAGTGNFVRSGTGAITLPLLTSDGAGSVSTGADTWTGTGAITLPLLTTDGNGVAKWDFAWFLRTWANANDAWTVRRGEDFYGAGAITLPLLTSDGAGTVTTGPQTWTGTGAVTLPLLMESGAGERVVAPFRTVDQSNPVYRRFVQQPIIHRPAPVVAGPQTYTGTGAVSLPSVTTSGTGTVSGVPVPMPFRQLDWWHRVRTGDLDPSQDWVNVTFRRSTWIGSGAITLPSLTSAGTGVEWAILTGSGTITLPGTTVAGAGMAVSGRVGDGAIPLPLLQASGAGLVIHLFTGTGTVTLPPLTVSAAGTSWSNLLGSGNAPLPRLSVSGAGIVNTTRTGVGAITLPTVLVAGTGTPRDTTVQTGVGAITLPMIVAYGAAQTHVPGISVSHRAYHLAVLMMDPGDDVSVQVIWEGLNGGLASVVYVIPSPLTYVAGTIDNSADPRISHVRIRGAVHAQTYPCSATATLLDGTTTSPVQFTIRGFNA